MYSRLYNSFIARSLVHCISHYISRFISFNNHHNNQVDHLYLIHITLLYTPSYIYLYIYRYIYLILVCVCVCDTFWTPDWTELGRSMEQSLVLHKKTITVHCILYIVLHSYWIRPAPPTSTCSVRAMLEHCMVATCCSACSTGRHTHTGGSLCVS